MAALVVAAVLLVSGVDGPPGAPTASDRAVRVSTSCVTDGAWCNPPANPWDLVPPGTHCLELLPYAMAAGIAPEDAQWYLNVALGETHCWDPAWRRPNMILPGGTWGPTQIHWPSWRKVCGWLDSPRQLLDETEAFRCTLAVEAAGGRRQWRPHNEITGLFPGQT